MTKEKKIAGNSACSIINNLMNITFSLVSSIYTARILLPEGVGRVDYVVTIVAYFIALAALGLPAYGIRAISQVRDNREEKNRVFSELFLTNSVLIAFFAIVYASLILFVPSFRADYVLFIAVGLQFVFGCCNVDWLFQGEEEYKYIVVRNVLAKLAAIALLFLFVKTRNDCIEWGFVHSFAYGVPYLMNLLGAKKFVSFTFEGLHPWRHLKPILYLGFSVIFVTIYSKIDITMLGIMNGNEAVGLYSNAHKIINNVVNTCISVTAVFLPRISYLYENDRKEFCSLVKKGISLTGLVVIPSSTGLFILAEKAVLLLYGEAFLPSADILRIFTLIVVIKGFGDLLCYQVVISIGMEKKIAVVSGCAMLVNVCLNLLLIRRFGGCGAAIASVISELFLNVVLLIIVLKNTEIRFPASDLMKEILASGIMALSLLACQMIDLGLMVSLIISVVCGIIVYFAFCIVLKNEIVVKIYNQIKAKNS